MVSYRIILVLLVAVVLLGCNRTDPAPTPPVVTPPPKKGKDITKPPSQGPDDLKKQIENVQAELERLRVLFVISGLRDDKHFGDVYMKIQGLKDASAKNHLVGEEGQYGPKDRIVRLSPVTDLEAAAAKVDFAKVTAVDDGNRVILLDAAAKPVPRPEKGWPGAKAVDQYVVRKAAQFFDPKDYAPEALKKFGRDQIVLICQADEFPSAAVLEKLKGEAPVTPTEYNNVDFGPEDRTSTQKKFSVHVMAPVDKMGQVVTILAGTDNVGVDEELRFVLVGLDSLKPGKGKVK